MLNFDKETISIVQNDSTGAIVARGELTIVGLPNEYKYIFKELLNKEINLHMDHSHIFYVFLHYSNFLQNIELLIF